ncbi:MAG TPA: DUF948 domain-containing protein [Acidimicrobiales bacterium]|nr:DUF948 domain-containing protein [Acidimicrobiales bacterium]
MTTGEVAALIASLAALVLAVGSLFALASLSRTLRSARGAVEELRREAVPLLANLRVTIDQANAELVRVDGVMERAESISSTVDSASRLAYLAFGNPIIKAMAIAAGTSRAARRLRRRND